MKHMSMLTRLARKSALAGRRVWEWWSGSNSMNEQTKSPFNGSAEVTGWDVLFGIANRILSAILSIIFSILTLHYSFLLLDYLNPPAQEDGFEKMGMLFISVLLFIPIFFLYYKLLAYLIGKSINCIRGAK